MNGNLCLESNKNGGEEETSSQASAKELPMEEAYGATIKFARLVGLHLVTKKGEEQPYIFNHRAMVPLVICSLIILANQGSLLAYTLSLHPPFWFLVMQIPLVFGCGFSLFAYIQSLRHSRRMMSYMAALRTLKVPVTLRTRFIIGGAVSYALVLGFCSLFLLSDWYVLPALPSIIIICFVPSVLDLYMGCFIMALRTFTTKLTEKVRTQTSWCTEEVEAVAAEWILLKKLLDIHNKIFSLTVHLRLLLLTLQSMAYLFVLWGMSRWDSGCLAVVVLTSLPHFEVTLRLGFLCTMGERLLSSGEALLAAVRAAAYTVKVATHQHQELIYLTARMEAAPPAVHVWGMDSLSARTCVSLTSLVTTYALVLLQFCSRSDWRFTSGERQHCMTRYDYCFSNSTEASWMLY
ncbi:uncharacterized protein [Panulirus ornatus]|uniref:uncharacterized protein isoform X3 n=1 Tax=Panulirus ornatus TaxID=150431 RepID=UPI003A8B7CB4